MQTSIATDKTVKDRAAKRAKKEGLPLSIVVRFLLSEYADGNISIGVQQNILPVVQSVPVDTDTQQKMDALLDTWHGTMAA